MAFLGFVDVLKFRLFFLKNPNKTTSKEALTLSQRKKLPERSRRDGLSKHQQTLDKMTLKLFVIGNITVHISNIPNL